MLQKRPPRWAARQALVESLSGRKAARFFIFQENKEGIASHFPSQAGRGFLPTGGVSKCIQKARAIIVQVIYSGNTQTTAVQL
jgi:hypothetical protein